VGPPVRVSIAGSTGSIGTQTLDVIRAARGRFEVVALAAGGSVETLAAQAREFRPKLVALADPAQQGQLRSRVPEGTEVVTGPEVAPRLAEAVDVVVNSVVGFAGLPVTLAALASGCRLALANKESLIAGGPVVQEARRRSGAEIIPVDSEHCAIHQCLHALAGGSGGAALRRIVLTASGGPFRGRLLQDLAEVTVEDALDHPTWAMGPMNTLNSSTLMNKGLEVIEAHLLFDVDYDQIEVVVHPQSVVHSMVEAIDGSTIAQLSLPDMRLPIGYALSYPERMPTAFGSIDWATLTRLDFEPPDLRAFPCLGLAYEAGRQGGTAPTCLNAANEVAAAAFLNGQLRWVDIPAVIESTLEHFVADEPDGLAGILAADSEARALAGEALRRFEARLPAAPKVRGL
jgi:1-deoxy-D-xylulose-5-phosphate reductoisomerase